MLELHHHPLTPATMVRSLVSSVMRTEEGLVFSYHLSGDMARLMVPKAQPSERCDRLWEHTCFEAFLGSAGCTGYREFNFSPSGQWACYDFSCYRQPLRSDLHTAAPQITAQITDGHLKLQAVIGNDALPQDAASKPLRIGLAAVVETRDTVEDNRSYWALHHPTDRPDFHHPDSFLFELSPQKY